MRILVTGGKGTLGTALVSELKERAYDVISCDIRHSHDQVGFSVRTIVPDASYIRCDITKYRQLSLIIDRFGPFDYIYHLAAECGRWSGEDYYENLWHTNMVGTKNIIRIAEEYSIKVIFFSSSEIYGDYTTALTEDIPDKWPVKPLSDYAISKLANELQFRNSTIQFSTEVVIVRIFNIYGPGEFYSPYRSIACRFLYCALYGLPWTVYRRYSRTHTYVGDAVRTIANIAGKFRPGKVYNIAGAGVTTMEDLAEIIINETGYPKKSVIYKEDDLMTVRMKQPDASLSIAELGHENKVDLVEGIHLTAEWMREIYNV